MLHILIYYLRRLDEDTKIEWKWILLVNVTEALVCMCPRGFFSRHEHKGKLSSVLYIVGNALWLCTRENVLAIVVKLCHFYWYGCHLYAIHNFVWGISCIVSLSFSTLRARKAVSFFKDCCGLIHCDSSCSTECCVSGKLCAHISVACKLQKEKGTSASLTQLLLFFLTTHLLDLNLLIEVFHILLGMFIIFRDYNSQVCLMGISHVCY